MKKEQLQALNELFQQQEDLNYYLRRYEHGKLVLRVRVDDYIVDNKILNKIVEKYTVNIIQDLKEEIKKTETAIENISILQLNKLV